MTSASDSFEGFVSALDRDLSDARGERWRETGRYLPSAPVRVRRGEALKAALLTLPLLAVCVLCILHLAGAV